MHRLIRQTGPILFWDKMPLQILLNPDGSLEDVFVQGA